MNLRKENSLLYSGGVDYIALKTQVLQYGCWIEPEMLMRQDYMLKILKSRWRLLDCKRNAWLLEAIISALSRAGGDGILKRTSNMKCNSSPCKGCTRENSDAMATSSWGAHYRWQHETVEHQWAGDSPYFVKSTVYRCSPSRPKVWHLARARFSSCATACSCLLPLRLWRG